MGQENVFSGLGTIFDTDFIPSPILQKIARAVKFGKIVISVQNSNVVNLEFKKNYRALQPEQTK